MASKQIPQAEVEQEPGEYHQRDGWYFKRVEEGNVQIRHGLIVHTIPADEWASVVASVSAGGETSRSWTMANELHAF